MQVIEIHQQVGSVSDIGPCVEVLRRVGHRFHRASLVIGDRLESRHQCLPFGFVILRRDDALRLATGHELGDLDAFWATGTDTTETIYCSEYFYDSGVCTELGALSVQGKDIDRDEFIANFPTIWDT